MALGGTAAESVKLLMTLQGYWPDGIYTAPTDAALKYDIEVTKQMGFNMLRKHIKVEPDRHVSTSTLLSLDSLSEFGPVAGGAGCTGGGGRECEKYRGGGTEARRG